MMKLNKVMKGISFLLCLGFLAFAQNVSAQSATPLMDDYIKHMNANYRECLKTKSAAECQKEKDNYSEAQYKKDKQKEAAAAQSQQNSANNTTGNNTPSTQSTGMTEDQWNKYNATSGNYSVSPSDPSLGSKTSSSTTSQSSNTNNNKPSNAPTGVQLGDLKPSLTASDSAAATQVSSTGVAEQLCAQKGKDYVWKDGKCEKKLSFEEQVAAEKAAKEAAKAAEKQAKAEAKAAEKETKALEKAEAKTAKEAKKAQEKAFELEEKLSKKCAGKTIDQCLAEKEEAYSQCGTDEKCKKKAYKEWEEIKELNEKSSNAQKNLDNARSAAQDAELATLTNKYCAKSEKWVKSLNGGQGGCAPSDASDEDIKACGGYDGKGFYRDSEGNCYMSSGERKEAVAKKEQEKKDAYKAANKELEDATKAYDDCISKNGATSSKCDNERQNMEDATANFSKAEFNLGSLKVDGDDSVDGGDSKKTAEELASEAYAAAHGGDTRCSSASLTGTVRGTYGIFDYLACKITTVVADVRVIVYILACFGMIAFAYGAIIGKINWKQLANMGIGLFVLSMMTSFIEYFAYNGNYGKLPYGSYLPNGNHAALMGGSGDLNSAVNCSENNPEACPDVQLNGLKEKADKSSFSWSDIKSAFSSARDAVNTVTKAASTVKNTVNTTMTATGNIVNAIKNGGNVIDVAATIGTNFENISRSIGTTSTILAQAGSDLSNNIQDIQMTNQTREYVDALRASYAKIAEKCGQDCNGSKCNDAEKKSCLSLKADVDQYTTSVDKWLSNDGRGGGATILAGIEKTTKAVNAGAGVTRDVQQAKNQGESQGDKLGLGSGLSSLLGIGYAIEEGANSGGAYVKQVSQMDYRSQQTKTADAEAAALAEAKKACASKGGTYNESTKKCTKAGAEIDLATGAEITTTKNADGSTTQTSVVKNDKGGTVTHKTVTNADGSISDVVVTQNEDGSSTVVLTENGKKTTVEYDAQGNKTVNGVSDAQQNCIEKQGGQWVNGQCINATRVSQNEIDCKNDGLKWSNGKCDTSEKDKCLANKDIWLGAKGCEKVSDADKCSDGEEWDSSKKQCKAACPENQRSKAGGCCANGLDENGYCNKCPAGKIPNKNGTGCCDKLTADGWCDTMSGVDFKNNQNATAPQRQSELCKKSGGEWDAGLSCCKELGTPLKNITDFERCNMHNTSSKTKNNTKNNNSAGNDGVSILINGNTNQNQGTDWSKPQIGNTANKTWGQ